MSYLNIRMSNKCFYMGTREIQSVFSSIRNIARKNCPEKVSLVNKLERISLSHYSGKLSAEKTRVAVRQVLLDANENPTMLDMAEAQAKASKMFGVIPDYVPSSKGSVVGLLNKKQLYQKSNVNNSKGIFSMVKVKQIKSKGLVFNPSIVGGKVNNNKTVFGNFDKPKQIQSKGIFKGINLKQKSNNSKGIFENIQTKSKPVRLNFGFKQSKSNGIFGRVKQSRNKSILELMNEGRK